jgi:hypothetical protein
MILKTEYKKVLFSLEIEKEHFQDYAQMMGDKFNRLPPQTLIEIKKGNLCSYNILIESQFADETYTHYLSSVLLTSNEEEFVGELGEYLDQEETFEEILKLRTKYAVSPGPEWRVSLPLK